MFFQAASQCPAAQFAVAGPVSPPSAAHRRAPPRCRGRHWTPRTSSETSPGLGPKGSKAMEFPWNQQRSWKIMGFMDELRMIHDDLRWFMDVHHFVHPLFDPLPRWQPTDAGFTLMSRSRGYWARCLKITESTATYRHWSCGKPNNTPAMCEFMYQPVDFVVAKNSTRCLDLRRPNILSARGIVGRQTACHLAPQPRIWIWQG